jgi:hypothetical protein
MRRKDFDSRIERDEHGCWLWTGPLDRGGYGRHSGRSAHRLSFAREHGPIPCGMQIDHVCRVRRCVNPAHLRLVTLVQNILENSLCRAALNAAKTECPRCGSAFRTRANGSRECVPCHRRACSEWRKRNRDRCNQHNREWKRRRAT